MDIPLVSVIIPCYNASKYVEQAVRSIMEQTYTNLEIICCDDCSIDDTLSILNKLAQEDSRITVLHNEKNLKLIDTLNKLVSYVSGQYIARMDSDDISLPERIEKQVNYLLSKPELSFCGCNAWHIAENGRIIGKSSLPQTANENSFYLKYFSTFYHPTIMIKSEVLKSNLYNKDFIHAEDFELWCRLVFERKLKGENLEEKLFKYRINSNGVSKQNIHMQLNSSAKIFLTKGIVNDIDKNVHCNIFFNTNLECKEVKKYLLLQRNLLKKTNLKYSKIPFIKMFRYCVHNNLIIEFFKLLCTRNGFYSFLCFLGKKF